MQEDNPIARHLKLQVRLVAAWICFFRPRELGTHARVRHVCLNRYLRPGHWFTVGTGQFENNRSRTDPDWLRRDFMLNRGKS